MANETEISNIIGPTDVISSAIASAAVDLAVVAPLMMRESVPDNTAVKLFRQAGSLTAEEKTESASYSFSSSSEYTETSTSATAAKQVVISKFTVESARFRGVTSGMMAQEQGAAIARLLDDNVLTLFSSFTNGTTASSVLTPDDCLAGAYNINAAPNGNNGRLRQVISMKQLLHLQKFLVNTGAVVWSTPSNQSLFSGIVSPNGYVGSIGNIDFFATNGLPTTGGDDISLIFNPDKAIGAMYDSGVTTNVVWKGSEGLWWEITSFTFSKAIKWVDTAASKVRSDS